MHTRIGSRGQKVFDRTHHSSLSLRFTINGMEIATASAMKRVEETAKGRPGLSSC